MSLRSIEKIFQGAEDTGSRDQVVLAYLHSVATIQDDRIQKRLLEELIQRYFILGKGVGIDSF